MKTLPKFLISIPLAASLTLAAPAAAQVPAPVIGGAVPPSSASPRITGGAPVGSTVALYESADCGGPVEDTGSAVQFWAKGLQATVAPGATVAFSATATDAYGLTSACSAPFAYRAIAAPQRGSKPRKAKRRRAASKRRASR